MLKIAVLGAGRMGREVVRAVLSADDLQLAGVWARGGRAAKPIPDLANALIHEQLDELLEAADVAVDFSLAGAIAAVCSATVRTRVPLVCGVTGLDDAGHRQLQEASRTIPLLYDRNMSLGIAVLRDSLARAAPRLGTSFAAEIHETHHVHKKDAPSGTAIALGELLAASRKQNFSEVFRYDPGSAAVRRSRDDIVFSVTRCGEVAGEHTVVLRSDAESVEFTHKVRDRAVFALGALQAARWLSGRAPGLYQMSDVLVLDGGD